MYRRVLIYATSAILLALISVLVFTSREYSILLLQEWFAIPGTDFRIGRAIISKPNNWMLLMSRKHDNEKTLFFGMFPEWVAIREVRAPMEPFYMFKILDKYQVVSHVDFIEIPIAQNTKLTTYIQNFKQVNMSEAASKWELMRVKQWDALSSKIEEHGTAVYVDIPELKLSIRLSSLSILDSIDIREAPEGK